MYPSILYEDSQVAVLEKGAGMVVNRAGTVDAETLQDWVEENIQFDGEESGVSDFVKRSGIVHRLDRETSGIILVGKNERSFLHLQSQFKNREVAKEYTLLVHGHVKEGAGSIVAPIARLPWNRMRFGVVAGGRDAHTDFEVVERRVLESGGEMIPVTLVRAFPKTGRTHQLRVHFKHINHPLFADHLYGGRKMGKRDRELLARQFLHASAISFHHPDTGELVHFESPLPPDLVAITLKFA